MPDTSALTTATLVKTPAMVELVAKELCLLYGDAPPNNVWPSFIPQANDVLDVIIAAQLTTEI